MRSARWAEPLPAGAGPLASFTLAPKPKPKPAAYAALADGGGSPSGRSRSPRGVGRASGFAMRGVNFDELRAAVVLEKAFRRHLGQKLAKKRCCQVKKHTFDL